ncbi:hypothetical protein BCR43DRAFT_486515 [Syncephalastrum racemosum]|uniref:Uncharacterized protein n=1 Tax=Syncephalastrum racemosum TaxID=13706 RepID=A0A1X2HP89_SYNRA|nr:hypothetical protein BCR43DRAFT_486515 [Syncephalastrum racemosum]
MRLWIHQPNLVSHKPLDFRWKACNEDKMVFEPQDANVMTLQSVTCPQIDGCTVLIKVNETRRIYSISYKDRIIPVPLQHPAGMTGYDAVQQNEEDAYGCAWRLNYDVRDENGGRIKRFVPRSFECDVNLLNPEVLMASSREKVVVSTPAPPPLSEEEKHQKEQEHKKAMYDQCSASPDSQNILASFQKSVAVFLQWIH